MTNEPNINFYTDDDPNVLAQLVNGDLTATIITVPSSALGGEWMVLFPTVDRTQVIVAVDHDATMARAEDGDPQAVVSQIVAEALVLVGRHYNT